MERHRLDIAFVSDVACPWCAIGLASLDQALALKRALLRAYHGEGRNPGAADVLVDLAGAVGLDAGRAKSIAEGDEFAPEVRERERYWRQRGVAGVPHVVVNDSHVIEGAQPPEAFEQALRQIALSR